ncbi:hypothetical protein PAAG_06926 [Paracoccidioides lutzii Pb01]|uniref:LPXTG-motif cell wall anchor domain-containing protein n=1 Tax=Paracoccidioides lutzii (strain ATCC MYA-826 / Pb01) TaxID=502779 RepID=C1H8D0_PARBA|nr:hypothetical protein PAAG_06926 [Paracoccidioides lutzii Pb01]EEH36508.1 hypothetical protein PAAG_06926 [Paracoccidioides lutzii Pb01]
MPLAVTSNNSNSHSTSTLTVTEPKSNNTKNDRRWLRSRRETDPLTSQPAEVPHADRRRSDPVTRRLLIPKSTSNLPVFTSSNSCPSNPANLSDPTLAAFAPRKINALKPPPQPTRTSIPTFLVQTPRTQTTVDLDKLYTFSSTDTTTNTTNTTNLASSTPPTASSSATSSHSLKLQTSLEPKSPHQKRPPASRSSCGIEASSGPPPALSTQRSLGQPTSPHKSTSTSINLHRPRSFGGARKSKSKSKSNLQPPRPAPGINAVLKSNPPSVAASEPQQSAPLPVGSSTAPTREKGKMSIAGTRLSASFLGSNSRDRSNQMTAAGNMDGSSKECFAEDGRSKTDDVFLNIAKSNSLRRSATTRTERKRSKFGLSGLPSRSSRANEEPPSLQSSRYDSDHVTCLLSQDNPSSIGRESSSIRSPTSTQHPMDENSRLRYFGVSTRSSIGLPGSRLTRTTRETSPETLSNYTSERRGSIAQDQVQGQLRTYRQSNLSTMRTTQNSSSVDAAAERSRLDAEKSRLDGTESTLSTTAPSTVWDELDDLKSRIRKLELTGKLPPSSAAAMSSVSGERPRTATTTATTLSSSPKHGRKMTPPAPEPDAAVVADQIHPLLHTALAKAKPTLNADVYRALETTAADALTLATILSSNGPQHGSGMSVVNGAGISDRQMRRKADSLCRGLTELCLALSDEQLASSSNNRPGSRDVASSQYQTDSMMDRESITPNLAYRRSASHEPEEFQRGQAPSTRLAAGSRLESRRASLLSLNTGTTSIRNTQENTNPLSTPTHSTPPSRLNRASTILRNRRLQDEDDLDDKTLRPISRAMTEINTVISRYSPRDRRLSREYTSNHPLPDQQQASQQLPLQQQQTGQPRSTTQGQMSIPLRRNYDSPGSNLPATIPANIQPGFRRYAAASLNTVTSSVENSLNEKGTEVFGSGTKNTGFLQLRPRTNSMGTRRVDVRQRTFSAVSDAGNAGEEFD